MESAALLCACGCGEAVRKARYPSQQSRYINGHQHRGVHNGNYRGGKVPGSCAVCGARFEHFPSVPKVTCGAVCYAIWQGLTTRARGSRKVSVTCTQCGAVMSLYPSHVDANNFCDRACQGAWRAERKWGPHGGNWRGGKGAYLRRQTKARDGERCVVCGFHLSTDVHHITPLASGGEDTFSNLLTLCPNHHRLAHLGIIELEGYRRTDWQPSDAATSPHAHAATASR